MAFELVHTSVPHGLKTGSSGFCTVAQTKGLAPNVALLLESLSSYKPYFPHYDENAEKNPVSYSHYIGSVSGNTYHILSRVCFYGMDYTGRSNKLAHHIVCESDELCAEPSSIFAQKELFFKEWKQNNPPQFFPEQIQIVPEESSFVKAVTWEAYTGDAGWAGFLAQQYLKDPGKAVFIIFDPLKHVNILQLAVEALHLLPEDVRWQVSFNTYFSTLPAGMSCAWRFCTPDCAALQDARRNPAVRIIDITKPLPPAGGGELQDFARTGIDVRQMQFSPLPADAVLKTPGITVAEHSDSRAASSKLSVRKNNEHVPVVKKKVRNFTMEYVDEQPWYRRHSLGIKLAAAAAVLVGLAVILLFTGVGGVMIMLFKNKSDAIQELQNENISQTKAVQNAKPEVVSAKKFVKPVESQKAPEKPAAVPADEAEKSIPAPAAVPEKAAEKLQELAKQRKINREMVWINAYDMITGKVDRCTLENVLDDTEAVLDCKIDETDKVNLSAKEFKNNVYEIKTTDFITQEEKVLFSMSVKKKNNDLILQINRMDKDVISAKDIIYLKTNTGKKLYFRFIPEKGMSFPPYDAAVTFTKKDYSLDSTTREYIRKSGFPRGCFVLCSYYNGEYIKYNRSFCAKMRAALYNIKLKQENIDAEYEKKRKAGDKNSIPQKKLHDELSCRKLSELKEYINIADESYKNMTLKSAEELYNGLENGSAEMYLRFSEPQVTVKSGIKILKKQK